MSDDYTCPECERFEEQKRQELERLKAERDELRAALERCRIYLEVMSEADNWDDDDEQLCRDIDVALAKTGGKS